MTAMDVPLKYVSRINDATLGEDTPQDFAFKYVDISAVTQGNVEVPPEISVFAAAPSRARRLAQTGDTLVSTVRTYLRAVAGAPSCEDQLVFSTGFAVIHPMADRVHPPFLTYQLQADRFIGAVEAISTGVSYPATTATEVGRLPVRLPSIERQRTIADFLDRETAQIDAVITKQNELLSLLGERREAVRSDLLRPLFDEFPMVPLRYLGLVTVGIVVTPSVWYVEDDEGVIALRGLNVRPEKISLEQVVRISAEGHAFHSKSRLRTGDVVVVRTGQAGAAAVVPQELHGANAIDLLIVQPGEDLDGEFAAMALNAERVRSQVATESVGALQAHFNVGSLKGVQLPLVPHAVQRDVLARWRDQARDVDTLLAKAQTSIKLMQERRAALISDAVTGRLDVDKYGKNEGAA